MSKSQSIFVCCVACIVVLVLFSRLKLSKYKKSAMSGISMQNSSRKLGEFTVLIAQVSEEVKCLCE